MGSKNKDLTKTTISLPADLHRRARAVAIMQKDTLTGVIMEALERYIAKAVQIADIQAILSIREKIAAGTADVRNWNDVEAQLNEELEITEEPNQDIDEAISCEEERELAVANS